MLLLSIPSVFQRSNTKAFTVNQPGVPGSPSFTEDKELSTLIENTLPLTTITEIQKFSTTPATH